MPPRSFSLARPASAACAATAIVALAAASPAAAVAPGAFAAKQKKTSSKKKKKTNPDGEATVNATFSVRQDLPGGFGDDHGPKWQQLTIELKDATVPLVPVSGNHWRDRAGSGQVTGTISYEAHASTADRSWAPGCDSAQYDVTGTYTGKLNVGVRKSASQVTGGTSKKHPGWEVVVRQPEAGIQLKTTGWFQNWDSIAMQDCITTDDNVTPGFFSSDFADPNAIGALNDDHRSVLLVHTDTQLGQTSKTTGTVKFSTDAEN